MSNLLFCSISHCGEAQTTVSAAFLTGTTGLEFHTHQSGFFSDDNRIVPFMLIILL